MDPSSVRHGVGEGRGGGECPAPPPRGGEMGGAPQASLSISTRILLCVVAFYVVVRYFREGGDDGRKGPVNSSNTKAVEYIGEGVESSTPTVSQVGSESLVGGGSPAADIIEPLDVKEGKSYATASLMEEVDEDGFPILKSEDCEWSGGAFDTVVELDTPGAVSGMPPLKGKGFERMVDVLVAAGPNRIEGPAQHSILVQYCMS